MYGFEFFIYLLRAVVDVVEDLYVFFFLSLSLYEHLQVPYQLTITLLLLLLVAVRFVDVVGCFQWAPCRDEPCMGMRE